MLKRYVVKNPNTNPLNRNLFIWLFIVLFGLFIFNIYYKPKKAYDMVIFSDFIEAVQSNNIISVTIQGKNIIGTYKNGKEFKSYAADDPELVKMLREHGIRINAKPEEDSGMWQNIFISWFPMLLLIAVWIFFMRQMQSGGGKAMAFGKSKARLFTNKDNKVTFQDVAGVEEAKEELEEVIEFLVDPKKFTKLGGRIPKGVLLVGPPGTGKTLLARAIAGEANVPFFSISGSDFVEMFVGVGASRVRDLFNQGKKSAPCIIFIDEIDAVGRHRGAGLGGGHDEREQTLNQLLVEMDGFESNEGVIVMSATNRPDVLDPALLRPGRFDRQIVVSTPDVKGRELILGIHTRKTVLAKNVDLSIIARGTPGFSGADLANLVNEAALMAARRGKKEIEMDDFEHAKDKVLMGVERRSMIIPVQERKNAAYHEAGHTLVAKMLPNADPIHKVTIIPRGRALGITQQLPIDERHTYSKEYLLDNITILLGGRVAEELVLNHMTTGAGNDIERATAIVRKMVCEWGMSEKLGPLNYGKNEEHIFLGREIGRNRDFSEDTAQEIDQELRKIITDCYNRAKGIIVNNMDTLHALANALLEKESLDGLEIDKIIGEINNEAGDSALQ
ncbi:MAG TPA: ATP-dependent zinc metalloprotease FtsH [Syntrophorhabdaceae bacterium]|jgi:cell division protease FtsH|nr:ATP-dependent zinc metalloprotease FtsH [Syntrophorhabdaceae bacterium]MDI9561887.1 ATP-dependent zinc metalloprotease FtsH [Pseudomonadota bacterium]OQC50894.1 MAG: ATP-dependent zinc metalloprotease FtsH [Deltaproteobacteria bacterium ADurb.Bin026]MBP8697612.1 ATP-dependent zinc metalloprotease FtsH [Syntrophorhabdaceae bacterium]MBV6506491.1 ATP-dependent zinc metalloprotease FtsH [Syntrophorhabdaceae bacterium]